MPMNMATARPPHTPIGRAADDFIVARGESSMVSFVGGCPLREYGFFFLSWLWMDGWMAGRGDMTPERGGGGGRERDDGKGEMQVL